MREHAHDESESLRPKASRLDPATDSRSLAAAATGRLDALDGPGMLGLQRAVGNATAARAVAAEERSPVHDVISSGGAALEPGVRGEMEARLGHNFSDVRVHTDSAAAASAKAVNAHAYTSGSNVVFGEGYDPGSTAGKTTLAHELTHVVQQRSGPVDGTPTAGGVSVSDPSDRFERAAVENADRVMAAPLPAVAGVQREEESAEDESVQGSFVQREEALEEEAEGPG